MKTVLAAVQRGEPLAFIPFVDAHGHFGPWRDTAIPHCLDSERIIAEMDRFGCDAVWMAASDPGYGDSMRVKNDYVFALAEKYPDRIIPYCTLSANEPSDCLPELKRCLARGRCIGVKMHVYEQPRYNLNSAFLQPILEILAENRLVYLNHDLAAGDPPGWEALPRAAARYPDVIFLNGHFSPRINDLNREHPNILDCTCAAQAPDAIAAEVKRLGRSDTMLVGSDFALFTLAFGLGMVAYADMAEADKQNILGRNAVKIMMRTKWFELSQLRCTTAHDAVSP